MIICKECNPSGNGYCAKHSTSGKAYMTKKTIQNDKNYYQNMQTIEIWLPLVKKSWFGLYKIRGWKHLAFNNPKSTYVDGKLTKLNKFVKAVDL